MSKSATSANLSPAWKQEVNRRVAAHMSHKAPLAREPQLIHDGRPAHRNRAALAAARVAERYAQAPSYSELLADDARNAMRAAEAASKAAQEAQEAAQCVLDGLEAAVAAEWAQRPEFEASNTPASPEPSESQPTETASSVSEARELAPSWRLGDPALGLAPASGRAPALHRSGHEQVPTSLVASTTLLEDSFADDPGEPIYANLIQFPRQMIATRRMRPRRAEGPLAAELAQPQLSIFEVDPASVSIEPPPTVDEPATPVWMRSEESRIEFAPQPDEELLEEPEPQPAQQSIKLAPLNRRLMALMVDVSLILATFVSVALLVVFRASQLPGLRSFELSSALAVLAISVAYLVLFLGLAQSTPGMRYAGVALSTFEGQHPGRGQRCERLAALFLSIVSLGFGLVWALLDQDNLMGHDRLSKTYLRML
ncbi:MAG TPA: RDD family protein [Terracidiphilus sp.]